MQPEHHPSQAGEPGAGLEREESISQVRPAFQDILRLAVWFGLLTGLLEVAILVYRRVYLEEILLLSRDFAWMAPVADVFLLLPVALILYAFARRWPRWFPAAVIASSFAFFLFVSLLLLVGQLSRVSIVFLAAGLAVQSGRMIAKRADRFLSLVRASLAGLAVLVGLILVGSAGSRWLAERRALQAIPPPLEGAPNVLLIVMDTVRAQSTSLNGYQRATTPNLDRLGQAGVVFERAIATSSWTLPSHASMFTGRYPFELSTNWEDPLDATFPTLAETLEGKGYSTAGFVANLFYTSYEMGLSRGFAHYEDYPLSPGQVLLSSSLGREITSSDRLRNLINHHELLNRQSAAVINQRFLRWLDRQDGRPFFVFLNYFDAHEPYLPPRPFDTLFGPPRPPGVAFFHEHFGISRRNKPGMTPEDIQTELDAYEGAIAYTDWQIGQLMEELAARGILEDTLVIVTSDHGEEFGEHRLFDHGASLYMQEIYVPLLLLSPDRIPAQTRVKEPVSLRDLPSTVLELLDLRDGSPFPGESWTRFWDPSYQATDPMADRLLSELEARVWKPNWYPVSRGDMKSVLADGVHYIQNGDGSEEMYDLARDLAEETDVAALDGREPMLRLYRGYLSEILAAPSQAENRAADQGR